MNPPDCRKCQVPMEEGQAMVSTVTGIPDMGTIASVSPGGPGKLVPCWKCPECGHSLFKVSFFPIDAEIAGG